jgi:tetratricopeptide (TPR) repeat protein
VVGCTAVLITEFGPRLWLCGHAHTTHQVTIACGLSESGMACRMASIVTATGRVKSSSSWVLAQAAYGHYYSGDVTDALDVARHADEVVHVPCTGAALSSALEARAYAVSGREAETRNALARAEEVLSHLDGDSLVPSAFGYNEAFFRFHEGNAYTHLRDVKSAMRAQDRALELCAPDNYADWAMTRLDRAQCLIYAGDIASEPRIREYGIETITTITPAQRRGIIALRGRDIMETLPEGEKRLPAARSFQELLVASTQNSEVESS